MAQRTVHRARRVGILLATGGMLFILSFGLEAVGLARPESGGQVVNYLLYAFITGLMLVSCVLLGAGLWLMRVLEPGIGRIGRTGLYVCIASVTGIGLTALTAFVSAVRTAQPPGYTFVSFGLGLLFSVIGPILLGTGLQPVDWLRRGWLFPMAVAGGAALAFVPTDPWHDVGLLIVGLSWAGLGISMLFRRPTASSVVR
jgi:hypothetical protein